jgi:hypothetical protein
MGLHELHQPKALGNGHVLCIVGNNDLSSHFNLFGQLIEAQRKAAAWLAKVRKSEYDMA